jgi:hypothetical protein
MSTTWQSCLARTSITVNRKHFHRPNAVTKELTASTAVTLTGNYRKRDGYRQRSVAPDETARRSREVLAPTKR